MNNDILNAMNCNSALTQTVKDYINNECDGIDEICLAVAGMGKKVFVFTARQYGIGIFIAEDGFGPCGENIILANNLTSFLETNQETIAEIMDTLDDAEDSFRMILLLLCAFLAYYEDNSSVGKTA